MKYHLFIAVLLLAACTDPEKQPMRPNKAAIVKAQIYDIFQLHFDINTPPSHPAKIEELTISGWNGRKDTITREYYYENDRLVKVIEKESSLSVYTLQYDKESRCILIDEQTAKGSFHKDSITYFKEGESFDAQRIHLIENKEEETYYYKYYGNTNEFFIGMGIEGFETFTLRESNDTTYAEKKWFTGKKRDIILNHQIIAFDKNGKELSITTLEKEVVDRTLKFEYDKYGNETLWKAEDVDNTIGGSNGIVAISKADTYYSTYEYDSKGNWTVKRKKNETGNYQEVITRTITYAK